MDKLSSPISFVTASSDDDALTFSTASFGAAFLRPPHFRLEEVASESTLLSANLRRGDTFFADLPTMPSSAFLVACWRFFLAVDDDDDPGETSGELPKESNAGAGPSRLEETLGRA